MESMEGRLMLANLASDFMHVDLAPAQFHVVADKPAFTISGWTFAPLGREGGFIMTPISPEIDAVEINLGFAGDAAAPQATPASPATPGTPTIQYPADPIISDALNTNSINGDAPFTEALNGLGGMSLFENTDIQPAVITTIGGMRSSIEFVGPVAAASYGEKSGSDEGGPISITAVLTAVRPLESTEPLEPGTAHYVVTTSDTSAASRLADASGSADRQITGELARAMVFEIAGGEPANTRNARPGDKHPNAVPQQSGSPEAARPVSYQDGPVSSRGTTAGPVVRSVFARPAALVRHTVGGNVVKPALHQAYSGHESAAALLPSLPLSEPGGVVANINEVLPSAEIQPAYASVFEQLGEEAELATDPPATAFSWRTALNATPLLMVLALERIATSNSRRASRQEAFVSTKMSLGRKRSFERFEEGS
jgi:hypothetical protein